MVSVPDTDGRYYLLPMLDMWTDVFASPGWRTTGTQAGNFLVTPPGWSGERFRTANDTSASPRRRLMSGSSAARRRMARGLRCGSQDPGGLQGHAALASGAKPPEPVEVKIDPSVDMKTPPKTQVDTMPAGKYFAYAAELLKLHPPHLTDQPIIAQMKRIGIEPGKSFDIDKARSRREKGAGDAPAGRAETDGMEGPDARPGRERLVDEHRHDGRLRQLLSEARHGRAARSWREPARGRDLSAESRRRNRQAARRREQIHDSLRQGRHAAGRRLLVDHALRY